MSAEVLLHSLFFAFLPDDHITERAHRLAGLLVRRHALGGHLVPPRRLHVSLSQVGMSPGPPPTHVIDFARRAGDRVALRPFTLVFDRVQSWRRSNGPLVLVGDEDAVAGIRRLAHALAEAQGLKPNRHLVPHLSLAWRADFLPEQVVEPFNWRVRAFVLIHSIHGEGRHEVLGRWSARTAED